MLPIYLYTDFSLVLILFMICGKAKRNSLDFTGKKPEAPRN